MDYSLKSVPEKDSINIWHTKAIGALDWKNKRVMDIGAAGGAFLDAVRSSGASELLAVEPNATHLPHLSQKGIGHHLGVFDSSVDGDFDVISCFEVIEHVYDPHPIVSHAKRLLNRTSGTLILSTPNAFNAGRLLKFAIHQKHHDPLMDPVRTKGTAEHIRAFSFSMVSDLFREHGFVNIRVLGDGNRYLSRGIVMAGDATR